MIKILFCNSSHTDAPWLYYIKLNFLGILDIIISYGGRYEIHISKITLSERPIESGVKFTLALYIYLSNTPVKSKFSDSMYSNVSILINQGHLAGNQRLINPSSSTMLGSFFLILSQLE